MMNESNNPSNKVFILLPDGVGLRNFVFTEFLKTGKSKGFEPILWNNTPMNLELYGTTVRLPKPKIRFLTDRYKNARIHVQLHLFRQRSRDEVYETYKFQNKVRSLKSLLKKCTDYYLTKRNNSEAGAERLRRKMQQSERKTAYYRACKQQLEQYRPAMVFCSNQRSVTAIAPLAAARDLKIPTACFIFSWDNLPKATMVVDADYYFVWSIHMKNELVHYYPFITEEQVVVTGTPQFEPHYSEQLRIPQQSFVEKYKLDVSKTYICFSGDDVTTSPDDEKYLGDLAAVVRKMNRGGEKIGILFRRCPVDFSKRYDAILHQYKEEIIPIDPLWQQYGKSWDTTVPIKEDISQLIQCITHSALVINLASSMVFDFVTQEKPCIYLNYDQEHSLSPKWKAQNVYNFVHFRSMPKPDPVFWVKNPANLEETVQLALRNPNQVLAQARTWFQTINQHPPQKASERIWEGIEKIVS